MVPRTIVVAGSVAQRPFHGGHAWVFLQYLLGFRDLGFEVLFVDRLEPGMCVDTGGNPAPFRESVNLRYLSDVMTGAGLGDCWTLRYAGGEDVAGVSHGDTLDRLRRSELLLNVMGFLDDEELLAVTPRRVFLDIDPGFGQMWADLGLADLFAGHDDHVTVGENIGRPWCTIPTGDIDWITTKPPVVLRHWPVATDPATSFTSIASWRGPFGPIEHGGRTYGLRVHEFRRFFALPERTRLPFEVALDIHDTDATDLRQLEDHGWQLVDPRAVARDPWRYADYIRRSRAELMIAKNMYVQSRSGWFSDRSACYLATGRPVLAQDTELAGLLPIDDGLVTFATLDEAVAGAAGIVDNYEHHAKAARAVAEEHFAADVVLRRLLDRLGVET